jgi:hypothetical protein
MCLYAISFLPPVFDNLSRAIVGSRQAFGGARFERDSQTGGKH